MIHWITPSSEIIENEGDFFINFTIKHQDDTFVCAFVVLNYGFIIAL